MGLRRWAGAGVDGDRGLAQRITRAKKKIAAANMPYRVPEAADLPDRLGGVMAVLASSPQRAISPAEKVPRRPGRTE